MRKLKSLFQNPKINVLYRVILAVCGGAAFTLVATVFLPELLLYNFGYDKASSLLWMMLLSFLIYSLIIIWVFSSHKLFRVSAQLLGLTAILYISFNQLQAVNQARLEQINNQAAQVKK
ncbi:hypothetical protein N7931_07040 [Catenovulum sp. 2E275]|uniref:hypothetical protein n=1 Tax=Catenovulum sp. 2E275 TaxID=2980497 RepID=UPI0021D0C809|nr:hypothetical protein [Catenovulum sp. 2E275]MCU4675387.1 hypothetical protein [Catenovulum sp. 2E275]